MKIDELASKLRPTTAVKEGEVRPQPETRPERLIGPVPFSICFPHTSRRSQAERDTQAALDAALEDMDRDASFSAISFDPFNGTFKRRRQHGPRCDSHLGGVEL